MSDVPVRYIYMHQFFSAYSTGEEVIPIGVRVGRNQLEKYNEELSTRDREILASLKKCKFLLTGQIQRLHIINASTQKAARRAAARELRKLKDYQGLMYFVKQMLRDGLITDCEFEQIASEYAAKLSPKTGTLLARNELLCVRNRANMGAGKEAKNLENSKD